MKITRLSAALAMLLASGFYACGDDDEDDTQPTVDSGALTDGGARDAAAGSGGTGGTAGTGGTGGTAGADAGAADAARDAAASDGSAQGADGGVAVDAAATTDGAASDASADGAAADSSVDAAPAFTPGQIVGLLEAANTGEINLALLAFSRTQNTTVLGFAGTMLNDHATGNGALGMVASASSIVPASSATQQALETSANTARAMLMGKRNLAFDRQYIQDNVTAHQALLDLLNGPFGASAVGTPLAATVTAVKTAVQGHLVAATAILQGLNALADAGTDAM